LSLRLRDVDVSPALPFSNRLTPPLPPRPPFLPPFLSAFLQICKRLGKREKALRHFLLALDFDPKDGNLVKAAIDRLELPEEEEGGEEEEEENF
jgi:hypothetical protein